MFRAAASPSASRALRRRVCVGCQRRPYGSQTLSDDVPRLCEPGCPVFANLEALQRIAADAADDSRVDYRQRVLETICQRCHLTASAGAFCDRRRNRTCPLVAYAERILATLEPLVLQDAPASFV